jgi:hypothetical protein
MRRDEWVGGDCYAHLSSLLMPSSSWLHSRVVVGKERDMPSEVRVVEEGGTSTGTHSTS